MAKKKDRLVAIVHHGNVDASNELLHMIYGSGFMVTMFSQENSIHRQLKMAEAAGAYVAVLVNSKYVDTRKVVVKNLDTGRYETVRVKSLPRYLDRKIEQITRRSAV